MLIVPVKKIHKSSKIRNIKKIMHKDSQKILCKSSFRMLRKDKTAILPLKKWLINCIIYKKEQATTIYCGLRGSPSFRKNELRSGAFIFIKHTIAKQAASCSLFCVRRRRWALSPPFDSAACEDRFRNGGSELGWCGEWVNLSLTVLLLAFFFLTCIMYHKNLSQNL